ncbi:MAG: type II secretion system protein D [Hydrogenophilales bacterium 16-64-46]|nr:MAG: type II secretion system protein D [Hydrogenophilales bacterium 12-64-13]OYZ05658.1 MAG: type II secretion system protein D [Hydrogenophilales bacterium 16-64-46]OZA40237.1 MAG: type II secretion system protein D [Hydrogenophilales bacterium 17-64-34]HQT00787.1 type II secretion system protein D [Thiobacillus sp.]
MDHLNPLLAGLVLAALAGLTGCASQTLKEGRELITSGQTEAGIERLRSGLDAEPGNVELRSYYFTQREKAVNGLLLEAQAALDLNQFDKVDTLLNRVLALHPENPRARALLANLDQAMVHHKRVGEAREQLAAGQPAVAQDTLRQVLAQSPGHAGALDLMRQIERKKTAEEINLPQLGEAARKRVTLELRDASLRNIFDMISRQSGLNFIFDKDVKLDTKATLFARDTPVSDAIDMLLLSGQLDKKVVNAGTALIYPDLPLKQKQYRELMVKSFYLGNADAKNTMAMLRTLVKSKDMFVDERLNLLIMRDTPEAIRLAGRLIEAQDLAEPEVMLEVEVLELKRGRLLDLGAQYPNQLSLLNTITTDTATTTGGVIVNTTSTTLSPLPLTADKLRHITGADITINTPQVNLRKEDSDVNLLANPRIRVKNREKAKIHIGDKVPVITTNTTSTGVVSESQSFLDVGLKLDVEPSVMMHDDVQIKIGLEVSNIVREVRSNSGTLTYQIGTRNAGTVLRLKDGETQVLAGLISDEDRSAASRVPGLGDLPLVGRLFSNQRDERNKTEIVLLITPRVLRSIEKQLPALNEFRSGTENAVDGGFIGAPALRLPPARPVTDPSDPLHDQLPESEAPITPAPPPGAPQATEPAPPAN